MVAPKRPSSFMRSTRSVGYSLACSSLLATGTTSRSTKRRMVSSSCAVSSLCSVEVAEAEGADMVKPHHVCPTSSTCAGPEQRCGCDDGAHGQRQPSGGAAAPAPWRGLVGRVGGGL